MKTFTEFEIFLFFLMKMGGKRVKYLPEIHAIFGPGKVHEFIEAFSGKVIKVPDRRKLQVISKRFYVWQMHTKEHMSEEAIIKALGTHGCTRSFIRNSVRLVNETVEELQAQFKAGPTKGGKDGRGKK